MNNNKNFLNSNEQMLFIEQTFSQTILFFEENLNIYYNED